MTPRTPILTIGEALIELGPPDANGRRAVGYGGDSLVAALYMARLLGKNMVGFVTRIGDDMFSEGMRRAWRAEYLDDSLCESAPGETTGLYAVNDTAPKGGPEHVFWRGSSPAAALFTEGDWDMRVRAVENASLVYFTGATLAALPSAGRVRLLNAVRTAGRRGAVVAFDPTCREGFWETPAMAREICAKAFDAASVVLSDRADAQALFGPEFPETSEHVLREQDGGVRILTSDGPSQLPAVVQRNVCDLFGASEAFNAAYLAARVKGLKPDVAASAGARLAAAVRAHSGALILRSEMPRPLV